MDDTTKHLVNNFMDFLTREVIETKDFKKVQFRKWSLTDFRVTIDVLVHDDHKKIFFDIREIKENQNHFTHLVESAKEQLIKIVDEPE